MPRSPMSWALVAIVVLGLAGTGCSGCGRTNDAEDIANVPPPVVPSSERVRRAPVDLPPGMRQFRMMEAGAAQPVTTMPPGTALGQDK